MYRLTEDFAKLILQKMRTPSIILDVDDPDVFVSKDTKGIGVIDPVCSIGTDWDYSIECPTPVIYPNFPFFSTIDGYFLYKREELTAFPVEEWRILKALVDPNTKDSEETVNVGDCSIALASDIDKLTAITIGSLDKLISLEPQIASCLVLGDSNGK